jgi:dephospho-CoA kinase
MGAGKSSVAAVLQRLGAEVINADREGHETYAPGSMGWRRIVAMFGEDLLTEDSQIDRRKLGQLVFGNPQALAWLNAALHPLIRERIKSKLEGLEAAGCKVAVIDAAVLVQAGWDDLADEVWVVRAPIEQAAARVAGARGLKDWEVRGRIEAQREMVRQAEAKADTIIDNEGTLDELRAKVTQLWTERNLPMGRDE